MIAELIGFERITVADVEIVILNTVQQHIHAAEVEGRRVLLLPENLIGLSAPSRAEQERAAAASGVVDRLQTLFARDDDFRKNLTDLLRCIELARLFPGSGGELTDHVFVGVAQNINLLRIFQPEVDAVQCDKHVAD